MAEPFRIQRVDAALHGTPFHGRLHHFATIDSTNTRALADAQAGVAAGQVYIADEQTAGRGRGGHAWHSEPERGLYLTALVRPRVRADDALMISFAAGVAASLAIAEATNLQIDLRWPNDLVTRAEGRHSRKLGGILTETASTPQGDLRHAAIGIGINLNQADFPPDLAADATSVRVECDHEVSREAVAIALLRHLHAELLRLESATGPAELLQRFALFSTWASGKRVRVAEGDGYTGVTAGLTAAGLLRVLCDDAQERVVRHGGVREV
ncbi:MAG: biotin--[acetyl-CoA-carboxylase] ligase [Janthinobacterium lividum]